jgi:hypothetical protein
VKKGEPQSQAISYLWEATASRMLTSQSQRSKHCKKIPPTLFYLFRSSKSHGVSLLGILLYFEDGIEIIL